MEPNSRAAGGATSARSVSAASPYRWFILLITLAVFGLSLMDRLNWSVVIPQAVPELGWTLTQAGAMMSAFYIGYIATQVPGGALADRFGPKVVLTTSTLLMGLFTLGTTLTTAFAGMLAFRVLAGLAAGPVFACAIKYQVAWFPGRERATAMGLFMLGPSLGTLLANSIVPVVTARGAWNHAFYASGFATLGIGLLVAFATRNSPAGGSLGQRAQAPSSGLRAGPTGSASPADPAGATGRGDPETQAPEDPLSGRRFLLGSYIIACVAGFLLVGGAMGILTWTTTYLEDLGLSRGLAGAMMSVYGIAGMAGTFSAGFLSDTVAGGRRKAMAVGGLAAAAVMAAVLGLNRSATLFWPIIVAGGLVSVMATPPMHTYVSEISAPTGRVGTLMGIYNGVSQLGPVFFPVVMGWILDTTGNYTTVYLTLAASLFLGAVLMATVRETRAARSDARG